MNRSPQVDVVILNYNGKRFLDECIGSLLLGTYANAKLYVVDNASTDSDVAYLKQHYPQVEIIQNPENNGYCAAYNLAFSHCQGKYFVCLNNDVTVAPDWLEHMVELAETDEKIAAIQPKLVSYFDPEKFEYAGAAGGMMDVYGYPFLRGRLFSEIETDTGQYDDIAEIFWTSGAAMFLRKSALSDTGNLDETIVHHMDEIDLCWRLRMAGYRLLVQPRSVIRHIGGATIQSKSYKKIYWNHRNALYIMLKNYELPQVLRFVPVHILLDYVAIAQAALTFQWVMVRGVLAAHCWLLFHLPLIFKKRKEVQAIRKKGDEAVLPFMYPGSVVIEFFFKKHKTYPQLTQIKKHENTPYTQYT
ncbi:MAG TPA: hypothetical protein DIW47_16215 [Bacteroidetes bacterium]|nr:hypothetical protein [Bacteroidota bacterium]